MIQVLFKNLEKSELTKHAVLERVERIVEKFPDLKSSRLTVTLEMHNSPHQPGPDLFTVKLYIHDGRYQGVSVSKSKANLFVALAEMVDHLLEALNRFGDRSRVKRREQARRWIKQRLRSMSEGIA